MYPSVVIFSHLHVCMLLERIDWTGAAEFIFAKLILSKRVPMFLNAFVLLPHRC